MFAGVLRKKRKLEQEIGRLDSSEGMEVKGSHLGNGKIACGSELGNGNKNVGGRISVQNNNFFRSF